MKAETGWIAAALVAALGVFGVGSQQAGKPGVDKAATAPERARTARPSGSSAFDRGPCGELEKTIQTFLLASEEGMAAPASCYGADPASSAASVAGGKDDAASAMRARSGSLRYVIAILPDPLHTHFSLTFDRLAESIQQGFQDEGYFFDSSWMPWEKDDHAPGVDEDPAATDAREDQPGVLLFRKRPPVQAAAGMDVTADQPYREGLAVLVVGEEPTTGIHKRQFNNALAWIGALEPREGGAAARPKQGVSILGPSFSGSLPSLAQLLAANAEQMKAMNAPGGRLAIFSGGISSLRLVNWFTHLPQTRDLVSFRSFESDGDAVLDLYRRYLVRQKFQLSHLAILSEDETAYGGYIEPPGPGLPGTNPPGVDPCAPEKDKAGPACLYYPRDISALRDAYQKQSIFSSNSAQTSADMAQRTLATDLADPEGKQHDTIRNYSANQTALSQEAVLQQIVSMLRAHESEYVVLRSSNPLDQLFLSHYLRLAYPEGRIVIEGSDLLLRRESGAATLSGIMTLTTYPLLPWEHHWTGLAGVQNSHSHRVFAQDLAEGNYVATRFMVHSECITAGDEKNLAPNGRFVPRNCTGRLIPDYAAPFWIRPDEGGGGKSGQSGADYTIGSRSPVVWLSVLGRDGFWPIAALNDAGLAGMTPKPFFARMGDALISLPRELLLLLSREKDDFGKEQAGGAEYYPGGHWPPMPLSMKLCLLTVFVWACFHFHCCMRPSLTVKPGHRAHFVRLKGQSQVLLLLFGSLMVALIPILLSWGYGAMSRHGAPLADAWWYRAFLPLTWLMSGLAVAGNVLVESVYGRRERMPAKASLSPGGAAPGRIGSRHPGELSGFLRKAQSQRRVWLPLVLGVFSLYLLGSYLLYGVVDFSIEESLFAANRFPTYWRSINLTTGVSPLVPLLALTAGVYCWFWYSLQGLALFGWDRPLLPREKSLLVKAEDGEKLHPLCMFSQKQAGAPIERLCHPFSRHIWLLAMLLFPVVMAGSILLAGGVPIRSLGSRDYSILFCVGMDVCVSVLLANTWQLLQIWLRLRQLLLFLDRTPLRRTLKAMKGYSWGSVWKMGGNVLDVRYKLLSRQFESLTHLSNSLPCPGGWESYAWCSQIRKTQKARGKFALWYADHWDAWQARDLSKLRNFQKSVAETAGVTLAGALLPKWKAEEASLLMPPAGGKEDGGDSLAAAPDGVSASMRTAEELVCLVYLGFIQNVLGRMRTLVMAILWLFVAATVSVATYPFDPRPVLSGAMLALFVTIGVAIVIVYSQMHRDATLSYVTDTNPGELGQAFWFKLLGFGLGPILGLLATIFPELPGSLFSWMAPGIASLK